MMAAVIIAISLMLMASKALTRFVNSHPTIVILCLSFLLMIGFSLIAEGFGFPIPKGYLYAAIGFSVMIESFNQLAIFNRHRFLSANLTLRQRTTEAVMNLLSGHKENNELDSDTASLVADRDDNPLFTDGVSVLARNPFRVAPSKPQWHGIPMVFTVRPSIVSACIRLVTTALALINPRFDITFTVSPATMPFSFANASPISTNCSG